MRILGLLSLAALVVAGSLIQAVTAANSVPSSRIGTSASVATIAQLTPPQCSNLNLTTLVTGSGTITGTAGNDLILGSNVADAISGLGGDDCIVGGAGVDTLLGGLGVDICLATNPLTAFTCEVTHLI